MPKPEHKPIIGCLSPMFEPIIQMSECNVIFFSLRLNSFYLSIFEALKAFLSWFNSAKQLHLHLSTQTYLQPASSLVVRKKPQESADTNKLVSCTFSSELYCNEIPKYQKPDFI